MNSKSLKSFLLFRLKNHCNDSVFWMYLVGIVVCIGGAGVWANFIPALLKFDKSLIDYKSVAIAIYTLFPSITVSSWVEALLPEKVSKPVRLFAFLLVTISLFWMMLCINVSTKTSIFLGIIGYIVALLSWIVAHGEDPAFSDDFDNDSTKSVGGDINKPISGSEGGLNI